jgi:hypothetical protein
MKIICFPFYHELLQTTKVNLTKKLSHTMHRKDLNNKNKVYNIKYKVIHKQLQQLLALYHIGSPMLWLPVCARAKHCIVVLIFSKVGKCNQTTGTYIFKQSKILQISLQPGMPEPRVQRVQVHPMPFVFITFWVQCGCRLCATGAQNT